MPNGALPLCQLDWDFKNSSTSKSIHTIHPFPAKFIPQIPNQIIDNYYPGDNSIIFDPFCGSGTTLLEANNHGIDTIGVDLHPIACLISKVKTTPIPEGFNHEIVSIIDNASKKIRNGNYEIPLLPNIDHWFTSDAQIALSVLISEFENISNVNKRNALKVSLSSIIVYVSNQESDTRYAAKENNITIEEIFERFVSAAEFVNDSVQAIGDNLFTKFGTTKVINQDILKVSSSEISNNIGLVITSPPYPNAYEYWLYHKYRMYWLGLDPLYVKRHEIGARPHYFKKNPQDEVDFENQMKQCFKLISNNLNPNGKVFFVIGRSIIRGKRINNVELIIRAAKPYGLIAQDVVKRNIKMTSKSFSHGNMKKEHIVMFGYER